MRVYAVIHSQVNSSNPREACKVTFFDYPKGAWDEIQKIWDSLPPWSSKHSHSFDNKLGNGKVPIPRIEWGETTSFTFDDDDTPNQLITFFSFWRPCNDWSLELNSSDYQPKIVRTLDIVIDKVKSTLGDERIIGFISNLQAWKAAVWEDELCSTYSFPVTEIESDPNLYF